MTKYNADMHIHSEYSFDSTMKIKDIIKILEEKKLEYLALTDHVEFAYESVDNVIDSLKKRDKEIDELQNTTSIKLIKGIEVAEPFLYPDEIKLLKQSLDFDFIMGSVHHINNQSLKKLEPTKENINTYLRRILYMVRWSQIDLIGHLDYIKHAFKHFDADPALINEILNVIIEKNIQLEINTSGIRRCGEIFPSTSILEEYISLGGSKVTLGSDAHRYEELYDNIEKVTKDLKELKLTPGVIINHEFKSI